MSKAQKIDAEMKEFRLNFDDYKALAEARHAELQKEIASSKKREQIANRKLQELKTVKEENKTLKRKLEKWESRAREMKRKKVKHDEELTNMLFYEIEPWSEDDDSDDYTSE